MTPRTTWRATFRRDERGESLSGVLVLLTSLVATAVVAGLIVAGLAMPAVGAAGATARAGVGFFDSLPAELKQSPLAQQSRILAADGSLIAVFYSENRIVVPLSDVSPTMAKAQVAIEDTRFYQHGGVDLKGIVRAAVNNANSSSQQGASTLTQQYVKLTLQENAVYAGDKQGAAAAVDRTYARKVRELKLAVSLEKQMPKDKILEGYLNIAYYGDGAYGVEAASRHYFGIHAKALSLPQAALLAGIVQQPLAFNPRINPKAANARRNVVLDRMLATKVITAPEHDKAIKTPLRLKISPTGNGCDGSPYGYFCNYVYRTLLADKTFGATPAERSQAILRGGLTITTTIDPAMQKMAQDAINAKVPASNKAGVGAAMSVIEPGTGKILAMAQNTRFSNADKKGFDAVNYNVDKAYGGGSGFQTGSTFKAFTLATALEQGRSLTSTIKAPPGGTVFPGSAFKYCHADRKYRTPSYAPFNSEGREKGTFTLLKATADSINTAFVNLEAQVGVCEVRDLAESLGVHRAAPVSYHGTSSLRLQPVESMTLGSNEVAPLTMAAAYATFAAGGVYCSPIPITAVRGLDGKTKASPKSSCAQVLDPDIASGVNEALQGVIKHGTAAGNGIGRPAAGKTGTTNLSQDLWFIGYTPQLAAAVWTGHPRGAPRSLNKVYLGGQKYGQVYGATIPAPIWKQFMTSALQGQPVEQFTTPSDKMVNGERVGVPSVSGLDAQSAQDAITGAGLTPSVSGTPVASTQPAGTAVYTSPGAGSRVRPGTNVTIYLSSGTAAPAPSASPSPTATPASNPQTSTAPPAGNGNSNGNGNGKNGNGKKGNGKGRR